MARGKRTNRSNRTQDYMASSKPNSPTKANTEYPNTPEKQDLDSKSYVIMMLEDFKKDVKNSSIMIKYDFETRSCFSGVFGYSMFVLMGELGSDDAM